MNNQIKERPILFNGAMVSAILGGSKTQTRRVCKDQPHESNGMMWWPDGKGTDTGTAIGAPGIYLDRCPYGQVGDQLWVRETWMPDAPQDGTWPDVEFYGCGMSPISWIPKKYQKSKHCLYRASWNGDDLVGWKPSIYMPRWASRIQLEITGVRVERLSDIREEDAKAEGVKVRDVIYADEPKTDYSYVEQYKILWESINGADSWDANPWVWVIEFKVIKP